MKFIARFKGKAWLYYLLQAAVAAVNITFVALMPDAYRQWMSVKVALFTVALGLSFGLLGFMLGDAASRKGWRVAVETAVYAAAAAGLFFGCHFFLSIKGGLDLLITMDVAEIVLLVLASLSHLLLAVRTATGVFALRPRAKEVVVGVTAAVLTVACLAPYSVGFFRTVVRPYAFVSGPVVFVNAEGYSILFATTAPGTGEVVITMDGAETVYRESDEGITLYNSQIHRVDVPRDALEAGEYYVRSTHVTDSAGNVYRAGRTITGEKKRFRPYAGDGDVSFLVISDNQNAEAPTLRAVAAAAETYRYDFVLLLGDHAETYNDAERDIGRSLLAPAAVVSRGELPVYFTLGNHEYRGHIAPDVWRLIPTPSDAGEFYYTFTMGDAFFTVLNFGQDHDDDYTEKYSGLADHNGYRDREYDWLSATFATRPYEDYTYHVCLAHIPMLLPDDKNKDNIQHIYDHVCEECGKAHTYKYREFDALLQANDVRYVVSGHTHREPALLTLEGCPYVDLNTGSHYGDHTHFRNVVVHLCGGEMTYDVYSDCVP